MESKKTVYVPNKAHGKASVVPVHISATNESKEHRQKTENALNFKTFCIIVEKHKKRNAPKTEEGDGNNNRFTPIDIEEEGELLNFSDQVQYEESNNIIVEEVE